MDTARRHEYLEAVGIDVWIPQLQHSADLASTELMTGATRAVAHPAAIDLSKGIVIGPGTGDLLLLCASSGEAASALAADIARSLDCEPVWSWPAPADFATGLSLEQAITERLFTRVVIFGREMPGSGNDPAARVLCSARLLRVESIPELTGKASARRNLWSELSTSNWCTPRSRK